MASSACWIAFLCLEFLSILPVHAQGRVHQITIRSSWGGLGPRADSKIVITPSQNGYMAGGQPIAATLVDALVTAVREPLISKPDLASLGVTRQWLIAQARSQEPHSNSDPGEPTAGQRALFQKSFSDMMLIARVLPELFQNRHTDDYPLARVEVTMDDNSKLVANSGSQFAYMLP